MKLLSCVWLFATPWTVAYQAPPSMGFSRQEYWSGVPLPSPGDLPNPVCRQTLTMWAAREALAISQRPHLQIPSCWGGGLQHRNLRTQTFSPQHQWSLSHPPSAFHDESPTESQVPMGQRVKDLRRWKLPDICSNKPLAASPSSAHTLLSFPSIFLDLVGWQLRKASVAPWELPSDCVYVSFLPR